MDAFNKGLNTDFKTIRKGKYPELDEALKKFVIEMDTKGVNVTLQCMEVKTKQLIEKLGNINDSVLICIQ